MNEVERIKEISRIRLGLTTAQSWAFDQALIGALAGEATPAMFDLAISTAKKMADSIGADLSREAEKAQAFTSQPVPDNRFASVLVVYPDGLAHPGVKFKCANGYVGRCVSNIADNNIPDAEWACEVLNTYGHLVKHGAEKEQENSNGKN